jgi:hypothetical protein
MDEWTKILDKGGKIDSIDMDFMKAFDKVPHRRLLHEMHSYEISEKVIKWVGSFLSNRIQKVIVNGTESKCMSQAGYHKVVFLALCSSLSTLTTYQRW